MNILICNDDGINAPGIMKLAEIAMKLGDVYVVAPEGQRSAASHGITIGKDITVKKVEFPIPVVEAYSVYGTPADCARLGVSCFLPIKPDIILSGINYGYNLGYDILYSGTVGAAREGNSFGVKAFSISMQQGASFTLIDEHLEDLLRELLSEEIGKREIWNINFPDCKPQDFKGVKKCIPASHSHFVESYHKTEVKKDEFSINIKATMCTEYDDNTDMRAISDGFISVSKI